jgi:hypothetical protein
MYRHENADHHHGDYKSVFIGADSVDRNFSAGMLCSVPNMPNLVLILAFKIVGMSVFVRVVRSVVFGSLSP